ncbi:MAG TPA: glycosyltransferase [Candidatus Angelobacter sp.]|jgi:spore maturation protein CgeB
MKLTIFGLSITSSWGNGHATTFRALCQALHRRGHRIVFFEHDVEWYQSNRDLPHPPYCDVRLFENWEEILPMIRAELRDSDVAMVGSYFPDGIAALEEVLSSAVSVKTFYDIDTPITIRSLKDQGRSEYVLKQHLPELDIYFSFTGGPLLQTLEADLGVRFAVPLYCSVDPEKYRQLPPDPAFTCDFSYMGTYAPDRQAKIDELLCVPAARLPQKTFVVAGPQYPQSLHWPENVNRIMHLEPRYHPALYSSSRLTLNVTRRDMVLAGYSPSVRLFEAAACGAAIVSDNWPGLESFLTPGREILLPTGSDDVVRYLQDYDAAELCHIGRAAQERVLASHTSAVRAQEFEQAVEIAASPNKQAAALARK